MAGNRYGTAVRRSVEMLRKQGKTYREIRTAYPIPKSTLSVWLGKKYPLFDKKAQTEHLKRIRILASQTLRERRLQREQIIAARAREATLAVPLDDQNIGKSLLAMLYWAEGAKTHGSVLKFANTDPKLALLYITLLRRSFPIHENKLRIRVHVHYYHKKREVVRFWSTLLRVPESQFGKLYVKKRGAQKRFRKNSMGICFITYLDVSLRKELMELGYGICGRVCTSILPSSFNG